MTDGANGGSVSCQRVGLWLMRPHCGRGPSAPMRFTTLPRFSTEAAVVRITSPPGSTHSISADTWEGASPTFAYCALGLYANLIWDSSTPIASRRSMAAA